MLRTLFLVLCSGLFASHLSSQQPSIAGNAAAIRAARQLYYTPADSGLQGFRCEVDFGWKDFIQKAANGPVSNDSRLRYLQSIQLTVEDDLLSGGHLQWLATAPPPDSEEEPVAQIRNGFQQLWAGFFQTWNGFATGDLVSLDARANVTKDAAGYRVSVATGSGLASEQFTPALLLRSIHVVTPTLDSLIEPDFAPTPHGLMVTQFRSVDRQPPSPAATEVLTTIQYAPVVGFQLPSALMIKVGATDFGFHLHHCTVKSRITQP